jgi:ribosomal protein L11 methyltransferase
MEWFRLTLSPHPSLTTEEIDAACCELIEQGASGTTIEANGVISCFASGSSSDLSRIESVATLNKLSVTARSQVNDENWNEQCPEVWEPVSAGTLTVIPVASVDDKRLVEGDAIRIIPGQGFGTGHHPTTRMILETLSRLAPIVKREDLSIFDLGTGSGILAIAAAKLFQRPVVAVDNDPYAIVNAVDNVSLNRLTDLITPTTTPVEDIRAPFNLILANLYGEVLVALAPEVTRLALPGARAIVSGITELVRDAVVNTYTETHGWSLEEEHSDSGWHCLSLIR